jgi:hypothetical protein
MAIFAPVANAAVHRNDVGIAHLLEIVSGKRGTESTAAIENNFRIEIWYFLLNIAFDNAFSQMDCAGEVILGVFALLAHIDQEKFFAVIDFLFYLVDVGFANAGFGVVDDFKKAGRMLVGHEMISLKMKIFYRDIRGVMASSYAVRIFLVSMSV